MRRGKELAGAVGVERLRGELAEQRGRLAEQTHRLREPRVDLGLRQRLAGSGHDRGAELHEDLRIPLREIRELPLLVTDGCGQHVIGDGRRLGHRRLDHHQQIELLAGLAPAGGVGIREERIGPLDDDRT